MNETDSKKLEEARKDYDDGRCLNAGGNYVKVLEAHIKEQDRGIDYWKLQSEQNRALALTNEGNLSLAQVGIERLRKLEGIAQGMVKNWNEFEQPMPLEWDMPDPMRTIHEWASEWKGAAEKAEARAQELEAEIEEREKRERYLADSNAEFVELLPQKDERIKELEQELLWAADACEKAENLLAEKEKI